LQENDKFVYGLIAVVVFGIASYGAYKLYKGDSSWWKTL